MEMGSKVWIQYVTALGMAAIAISILYRDPRSFVHRVFAVGMILFSLDSLLNGISHSQPFPANYFKWQRAQLLINSVMPVTWLIFSISFAWSNYWEQLSRWKWVLILSLVLPVAMVTSFHQSFVVSPVALVDQNTLVLRMGWSGQVWHVMWLICSVLILMNLEKIFRQATGHMRWQSKFLFVALGSVFGMRLFTDSQAILFKNINTDRSVITASTFGVAVILMLRAIMRGNPLNVSIHLSHQFLYHSLTVSVVGFYLVAAALVSWLCLEYGLISTVQIAVFIVFLSVIGVAVMLASDRARIVRKRFVSKHFNRPRYDYRTIWGGFTAVTTSVTETKELCGVVAKMVSKILDILWVSIWLVDEKQERLFLGGSTVYSVLHVETSPPFCRKGRDLIQAMRGVTMPVDLKSCQDWAGSPLKQNCGLEDVDGSQTRYCVPLVASGQLIGLMTLGEKVFREMLTFEESELIKTVADQAAASLLNVKLAERLRQIKEQEALQSMSAFFMHDLKNLASKLSLVTKNLPVYMHVPEYQADAIRVISQSVNKINAISHRLSILSQKIDLRLKEADLNELIQLAVGDVEQYIQRTVTQKLDVLPRLHIDWDQVYKVIENLLINAHEALAEIQTAGIITIATQSTGRYVEVTVCDNGCGMSRDFVEKCLFRPFQTTKRQGMGIGLYHSRAIVEAHSGRIEVESTKDVGTVFRVLLPTPETRKGA